MTVQCRSINEAIPSYINVAFNDKQIEYIRENIALLDLTKAPVNSLEVENYFIFYGIDFKNVYHYFGYYYSGNKKIACHVFFKDNSIGTVLLLHGYLEHSAFTFKELIFNLLLNNYSVAAIDLPGHGFSEGRRGDCRNFEEYFEIIKDFYNSYLHFLPEPYHIIGHSTGCVGIFEALYNDEIYFDTNIIAAPLIRSDSWVLSKLGMFLFGWIIPRVPSLTARGSTNREEAKFNARNDPLFLRSCPTSWVRSFYIWERKIRDYGINNSEVIILQGKKDRVLNWEYNIGFFKKRFPNLIIKYYDEANHTLFTEPVKNEVFNDILYYLKN